MKTYTLKDTDLVVTESPHVREYVLKIRDLAPDEKPREKLIKFGPGVLSVNELLAVVLNVGTQKEGVLGMSLRIMREYGEKSIMAEHNPLKMAKDLTIPLGKACQIVACGELGRRFYQKSGAGLAVLHTAKDVYEYLSDMKTLRKEHLRGIYLNTHNRVIHDEVISIGTINSNLVHPREVFRPAIEYGAAAIILAHNHPSDVVKPSSMDTQVTEQLIAAGKIIGIHILDHIIITREGFSSVNAHYS